MADFARSQLLKYGWTEGKGLGKHENGIAEALKPKLKFDTTGVGHDASEYHWWEFVYNKASKNLTVDTKTQDVKLNVKDRNAVDIKTSKSELNLEKIKKEQDLHYGSFIKTSTLENGKVTKDPDCLANIYETEVETSQLVVLNDEDLFKACGGRTAHKGARHGLKLNGKLARIERQEQELLEKMNGMESSAEWVQVEKKRKKKRNRPVGMDVENEVDEPIQEVAQYAIISNTTNDSTENFPPVQSKKTRRKAKRRLENLTNQLATSLALSTDAESRHKEKSQSELEVHSAQSFTKSGKKRKRKKQHCDTLNDEKITNDTDMGIDEHVDYIIEPAVKRCKGDVLEASVLNCKIEKRKRNKKSKKERKKLEKLSTSLMTLDLIETSETNDDDCKSNDILPEKKKKLKN